SSNGYHVNPVIINPNRKSRLNDNLMLFFTGFKRYSAEIQKSTIYSMDDKQNELFRMLDLVDEAQRILENNESDLDEFGRLLDKTWRLKRQTGNKISTDTIDELYEKGIRAGALGGKLLGAGGGGFLLFYVQPEKQESVRKALSNLMEVPFKFERSGTRVIYYTPEFFDKSTSIED
ncbi:MAG: kinase, partial [Clostridia bacterium]|nr:kinase [Clostridia bacterium]